MSGFSNTLLTGLATYLQAAGIGTWSPTGAYATGQTGIVLGAVPQFPDAIITLTAYSVDDSPTLSDSTIGVQVRTRCGGQDPRPVDDLADSIYMLLHGMTNVTLTGGVRVVQCLRQSAVSLGVDQNNRWMHSANYYLDVWRPSLNRT